MDGLNQPKNDNAKRSQQRERLLDVVKEVPRGTDTDIVVAVAVPVVDIEPVLVKVANAGEIAVRLFAFLRPYHWKLRFAVALGNLYSLPPVFYSGAVTVGDISTKKEQEVPSPSFIARYRAP